MIAEHFAEYKPKIELYTKGKHIDVGIQLKGRLYAFEVAVTVKHEAENIEKDFHLADAHRVIVACLNKRVLYKVEEIILAFSNDIKNRTKAMLISELLETDPEELINSESLNKQETLI